MACGKPGLPTPEPGLRPRPCSQPARCALPPRPSAKAVGGSLRPCGSAQGPQVEWYLCAAPSTFGDKVQLVEWEGVTHRPTYHVNLEAVARSSPRALRDPSPLPTGRSAQQQPLVRKSR